MSNPERDEHGRFTPVPPERVLSAFPGAGPRTTAEVADAADVSRSTAAAKLEALRDDGLVGRRELTLGDDRLLLWYPTTATLLDRAGVDEVSTDKVEAALSSMDYPGASEMMRDWRRDAVRAAYEYVEDHGSATDEELVERVYPAHSAGYGESPDWLECVRPRLRQLPGIVVEDGRWRRVG